MSNSSAPITSADEWRKYQEAKRSGKPYEPPPAPASEAQRADDEMWIDSFGRQQLPGAAPQNERYSLWTDRSFLAASAFASFIVCAVFGFTVYVLFRPLTPAQKFEREQITIRTQARMRVEGALKDPGSAEFRAQSGICGQVNAKNSFGAYTGFERFIATDRAIGVVFESKFPAEQFDDLWNTLC